MITFGSYFNSQIQEAFGKNSVLFHLSPQQEIGTIRARIPLIWIEYKLAILVDLQLKLDREPDENLELPQDPLNWKISSDYGITTTPIFETFVTQWNAKLLNRILGQKHIYTPNEIGAQSRLQLGKKYWCPVQSLNLVYEVHRQAWIGSVLMPPSKGELDTSKEMLHTTIQFTSKDLPTHRDPSWVEIEDPDSFMSQMKNVIMLEVNLTIDGFSFDNSIEGKTLSS